MKVSAVFYRGVRICGEYLKGGTPHPQSFQLEPLALADRSDMVHEHAYSGVIEPQRERTNFKGLKR